MSLNSAIVGESLLNDSQIIIWLDSNISHVAQKLSDVWQKAGVAVGFSYHQPWFYWEAEASFPVFVCVCAVEQYVQASCSKGSKAALFSSARAKSGNVLP